MKKIFILSLILSISFLKLFAQTINPLQNTEQCPGLNITFTVTISGLDVTGVTGRALNVSPIVIQQPTNKTVSGGNVTFNFIGKFADYNNKQTFTVNYTNASGLPSSQDFTFTKIKSLLTPNLYSQISPSPTSIISPPCQVNTHTISFPNVQFGNPFESPIIGYGTITTYEYLLPVGWVLNGATSNGTSWIPGTNSVSLTSNLSSSGSIQVRAINPCGTNLTKGQITTIAINRPKPVLTFTGGYAVCATQNFQAFGTPAWVTNYTWNVSPLGTVFGNTNPTANPTTVTRLYDGEGLIELTISTPSCASSFVYNTQEITGKPKLVAGKPQVTNTNPAMVIYNSPGDENQVCRYQGTTFDLSYTTNSTINWTAVSHLGGPWPSWSPDVNGDMYVEFFGATQNTLVLKMDAANTCGTTSYQFGFKAIACSGLRMGAAPMAFKISPNPVYNVISITPVDATTLQRESKLITGIDIADFSNNIISRRKFDSVQTAEVLTDGLKPGIYYVTIQCGKFIEVQKIIKQ